MDSLLRMQFRMLHMRNEMGLYQEDVDEIIKKPIGTVCRHEKALDKDGKASPYGKMSLNNFRVVYGRLLAVYNDRNSPWWNLR